MEPSKRIAINTLAQYTRTIINMALSLYSSRLVLNILGVEDYGIYSLVAGVVSMLSFITNSLVGSTQRFLSVSQGRGDMGYLKLVFGNSLLLHVILGVLITIILEVLTPVVFDGLLNIPDDRVRVAKILYQQVIWMVYISFIASPFKALLVSRENIIYTSVVDVIDGILKVVLVLCLPYFGSDALLSYGWILFAIQGFNLIAYMVFSFIKYEECVFPKLKNFSLEYIRHLSGYTGWVVYSSAVIAFRNQGLAILFNRVMGPIINAAYGIGAQLSSMIAFVSSSFNNAIAPQLMSSHGRGESEHMWMLAKVNSKAAFLLLAMIGVPAIFEMPKLLGIWLGNVPEYTEYFGSTFLLMQIIDQLSVGLGQANRAIGNIGRYTLITYTPKLLIIPFAWVALKWNMPILIICCIMLFFETLCMLLRIFLLRHEDGFSLSDYFKVVVWRSISPCILSVLTCYAITLLFSSPYRFVLTFLASISVFIVAAYFIALTPLERTIVKKILKKK